MCSALCSLFNEYCEISLTKDNPEFIFSNVQISKMLWNHCFRLVKIAISYLKITLSENDKNSLSLWKISQNSQSNDLSKSFLNQQVYLLITSSSTSVFPWFLQNVSEQLFYRTYWTYAYKTTDQERSGNVWF